MKRSKFSLSHYNLLSCDMGELVPIGLTEVIPGDSFQHATSMLIRVSPLMAPVMHPVHARIHHFFVPLRLIWDDWEDFITGGPDGMDASTYPTITLTYAAGTPPTGTNTVGSLADYLGSVPEINNLELSALPFRAYALIFNEFYRDQDLVTALTIDTTSGVDTTTNTTLQNIAWEKDYFTSARPWTQKGPQVTIPVTGDAPVKTSSTGPTVTGAQFALTANTAAGVAAGATNPLVFNALSKLDQGTSAMAAANSAGFYPNNLYADLSTSGVVSINDLRTAFALQRYEEARARWGSRYTEYLAYLGVRSSDARLQRPEYLGGGKQTIQFSEVLQTAPDEAETIGVGNLNGHGIGAMRSNRYRRFFEEHGYVVSLLSVRPRTIYTQGLARTFNRRVKEDYFQRELAHIGQQEIYNKEIYAASGTPTGTFGFQDRYDEYRRAESRVSGEFRTTALDYWHMARQFASAPTLNASFVTSNPTKRIHQVQTEDVLWIMANHSIQARRQVPASGKSFIF